MFCISRPNHRRRLTIMLCGKLVTVSHSAIAVSASDRRTVAMTSVRMCFVGEPRAKATQVVSVRQKRSMYQRIECRDYRISNLMHACRQFCVKGRRTLMIFCVACANNSRRPHVRFFILYTVCVAIQHSGNTQNTQTINPSTSCRRMLSHGTQNINGFAPSRHGLSTLSRTRLT